MKNEKYITRSVKEYISLEIQLILWDMVEEIKDKDYLQVFYLRQSQEDMIEIKMNQEQPVFEKKIYISGNMGKDYKLFVIKENTYQIMMLAEEY